MTLLFSRLVVAHSRRMRRGGSSFFLLLTGALSWTVLCSIGVALVIPGGYQAENYLALLAISSLAFVLYPVLMETAWYFGKHKHVDRVLAYYAHRRQELRNEQDEICAFREQKRWLSPALLAALEQKLRLLAQRHEELGHRQKALRLFRDLLRRPAKRRRTLSYS